jgi:4-alpha-glucanotransferase
MALSGSRLHTLGDLAGLARVYTNAWGDEQPIADETLRTLLTALGLGADTEAVAGSSVAEIDDQRWGRALEPVFRGGAR